MRVLTLLLLMLPISAQAAETRCGWFDMPSPANAWLIDKDQEWTMKIQGQFETEGEYPPQTGDKVVQNGNYYYGCTCAVVVTEKDFIKRVVSSEPRSLAQCRADPALRDKEPRPPTGGQ